MVWYFAHECTCYICCSCSSGKATRIRSLGKAIEDAALQIEESSLDDETKAYALFFLNVAYVDIDGKGDDDTFDFILARSLKTLPVDVQLALSHEGEKVKDRTALMRKQDKHLHRMLPRGKALNVFVKDWYDQPVNMAIERAAKALEKEEKKKKRKKRWDKTHTGKAGG